MEQSQTHLFVCNVVIVCIPKSTDSIFDHSWVGEVRERITSLLPKDLRMLWCAEEGDLHKNTHMVKHTHICTHTHHTDTHTHTHRTDTHMMINVQNSVSLHNTYICTYIDRVAKQRSKCITWIWGQERGYVRRLCPFLMWLADQETMPTQSGCHRK